MATAMPRMIPTGTNTCVSSHRSSSHPAPPHTAIPESIVPLIDQPVSAPLPPRAGCAGRGRGSPRGGRSSAIALDTIKPPVSGLSRPSREGGSVERGGRRRWRDVVDLAGPDPPQLDRAPQQRTDQDRPRERDDVEPAVLRQ